MNIQFNCGANKEINSILWQISSHLNIIESCFEELKLDTEVMEISTKFKIASFRIFRENRNFVKLSDNELEHLSTQWGKWSEKKDSMQWRASWKCQPLAHYSCCYEHFTHLQFTEFESVLTSIAYWCNSCWLYSVFLCFA